MIFKVENLGAIQHAEIDLSKDLILFCGHNNTGKTYLINAIYRLLSLRDSMTDAATAHFGNTHVSVPKINIKSFNEIQDKINILGKPLVINIIEVFNNLSVEELNSLFKYVLGTYLLMDANLIFTREEINNRLFAVKFATTVYGEPGKILKSANSENIIFERSFNFLSIIIEIIDSLLYSRRFIFPVERSSINIFSKELSLCKVKLFEKLLAGDKQADLLDLASRRVNRYPKPIRDHLEIAEDLANLSKNTSEFNELAEELEKKILGGKVRISQYGDLTYQPDSAQNIALGMELSSSTVGSLSSLVFYLRHLAKKGDTLIIDEPELSLHPDNQRLIARFFGSLINAGFKLIISTHSDYIVREMNNLIMLSKKSHKTAGLRKKYGYTQAQVLQPQQVGAYLFKRGEPSLKSIEITETGLEISTIDEVVADLNQSSQDIYFSLFN